MLGGLSKSRLDQVRGEPGLADPGRAVDEHHRRREVPVAELLRRLIRPALPVGIEGFVDHLSMT